MWEKFSIGSAGLLLVLNAGGIPLDNRYQAIVERNAFGLKPQTPLTQTNAPAPPADKIVPTGLTTILGRKMALFKVQSPGKPPQPAKEESFILGEGERAGEVEVMRIDEQVGTITFNNRGTVIAMNLERDGAKPPSTPPAVAPQPVAAVPGGAPPALPVPGAPIYHTNAALRNLPTRHVPVPPAPTPMTAPADSAQGAQQKPLTAEEQIILMELERERSKGQVQNGSLPPLPPTPIAPP